MRLTSFLAAMFITGLIPNCQTNSGKSTVSAEGEEGKVSPMSGKVVVTSRINDALNALQIGAPKTYKIMRSTPDCLSAAEVIQWLPCGEDAKFIWTFAMTETGISLTNGNQEIALDETDSTMVQLILVKKSTGDVLRDYSGELKSDPQRGPYDTLIFKGKQSAYCFQSGEGGNDSAVLTKALSPSASVQCASVGLVPVDL